MRGKHEIIVILMFAMAVGCQSAQKETISFQSAPALSDNIYQSLTPEQPVSCLDVSDQRFDAGPLNDFNFNDPGNFLRFTLDQCIENALQSSEVIRELGGTVLRSPELIRTENDPALSYTDPRNGEEAALSAFDANFSNQFSFQNNDRAFNSSFVGDQGRFEQKLANNTTSLSKRSATGGQFQLIHQVLYDFNNTQANRFTNDVSYDTFLAGEFRQPLLQGGGVLFNRIAGPNNQPGVNNGVLIARTNTDITLANFELGVRNLVSEVENAYWDLYFAYRDLESKIEARNGAYAIWNNLKAEEGSKKKTEILQAEEQYYLFSSRVKDAIHGQLNDGTRTFNGSSSGTFRGNSGVRTAERRLRLIAGFPVNEGLLIVPQDIPVEAKVVFDWEQTKNDALSLRTELRRQRWVLKREELNLVANKNHLLPSLDFVGKYRLRGFGNDLFGSTGFDPNVTAAVDPQDHSDAFATFLDGDLQEWELGMDLNVPLGYRRQMAAVRNSELSFMREKKILREQEREIIYGLSNALGEVERTSSLMEANTRRLDASKRQYEAIQEDFRNDDTTIDLVLESQRRVIDAKLDYFRTQVEFMLAVKSVHFEKGTGLSYHNVSLSENGWCGDEYRQALDRERLKSSPLDYICHGLKVSSPIDGMPQMGFTESSEIMLGDAGSSSKKSVDDQELSLAKVEAEQKASLLLRVAKKMDEEEKANDPATKIANLVKRNPSEEDSDPTTEAPESESEETIVSARPKSLLARLHDKARRKRTPAKDNSNVGDNLKVDANLVGQKSEATVEATAKAPLAPTTNSVAPGGSGFQPLLPQSPTGKTFKSIPTGTLKPLKPLAKPTATGFSASTLVPNTSGPKTLATDPWTAPSVKMMDEPSATPLKPNQTSRRRNGSAFGQLQPLTQIRQSLSDQTLSQSASQEVMGKPVSVSFASPDQSSDSFTSSLGAGSVQPASLEFKISDLPAQGSPTQGSPTQGSPTQGSPTQGSPAGGAQSSRRQ